MINRFEVISHPSKFRLKPAIWVEPPGTTTTEWPITTTTEEPDVQYVYYDDGIALWRKGVRDGCFVWDKALTPIGFNGVGDTDWENVKTLCPGESSTTTDDGIIQYVIYYDGITEWRKGVRDGCFVWDRAITLTGFDGIEDTDWENVRMLCGVGTTTTESPGLGFGLLYNWFAVNDARGIAPIGWHVPTNAEFATFIAFVGVTNANNLKETGVDYWAAPNSLATDLYGFKARGAGARYWVDGSFNSGAFECDIKEVIYLLKSDDLFLYRILYNNLDINGTPVAPNIGASIRCIRDTIDGWVSGEQVADYDGNIYDTVQVGTQVWMVQNLAVAHYNDGSIIPEVTDNATWAALMTGAMCAYNNDWNNV